MCVFYQWAIKLDSYNNQLEQNLYIFFTKPKYRCQLNIRYQTNKNQPHQPPCTYASTLNHHRVIVSSYLHSTICALRLLHICAHIGLSAKFYVAKSVLIQFTLASELCSTFTCTFHSLSWYFPLHFPTLLSRKSFSLVSNIILKFSNLSFLRGFSLMLY